MPSLDATSLAVMAVLFVATLFRSAFGFGEALLAVPLLALVMPVQTAVPIAVLVSISMALMIVIQDWHNIHFRSAGWLLIASLFGIPLGLLLLKRVPETVAESILGVVIAAFALYSLMSRGGRTLHSDRHAWMFGFAAGLLGGAYGMNGPPLVVYGALRRWTPVHFRATLQAYFLPAGLVGITGYWLTGLWTAEVTRFYGVSLPGVVLATLAGREINRRLHPERFASYLNVGLLAIGSILLWRAWRG